LPRFFFGDIFLTEALDVPILFLRWIEAPSADKQPLPSCAANFTVKLEKQAGVVLKPAKREGDAGPLTQTRTRARLSRMCTDRRAGRIGLKKRTLSSDLGASPSLARERRTTSIEESCLPVKVGDKPLKRLDSREEVRFGFRSAGFGFRSAGL
jgi:hypothetical protein